ELRRRIHDADRRDAALRKRNADLAIDEIVIEADLRRIAARVGIIDALDARPVDRAEAHRARLAVRVDVAAFEAEGLELGAGAADRGYLSMAGAIVGRGNLIPAFGDHQLLRQAQD